MLKRAVRVTDRGLLSLDNLAAVEALRTPGGVPIELILAVPGRRYAESAQRVAATPVTAGCAKTTWQGRRLVIAHDLVRAGHRCTRD